MCQENFKKCALIIRRDGVHHKLIALIPEDASIDLLRPEELQLIEIIPIPEKMTEDQVNNRINILNRRAEQSDA